MPCAKAPSYREPPKISPAQPQRLHRVHCRSGVHAPAAGVKACPVGGCLRNQATLTLGKRYVQKSRFSHRLKTARKWWVLREGGILIPETFALAGATATGCSSPRRLHSTPSTLTHRAHCGRAREFRPKEACEQQNRKNGVLHSGRGSGIMTGEPHYCLMQTAPTTLSSKRTNEPPTQEVPDCRILVKMAYPYRPS